MLFRDAEVFGVGRADVHVEGSVIADVGPGLRQASGEVVDCDGSALLPGLHDHHCHLLACAAWAESVVCAPPEVCNAEDLASALASMSGSGGWVRGVGYDERVAGVLDRWRLDELSGETPVRIQHRSGALWTLNSAGVRALQLEGVQLEGVERDKTGRPTGRLWRMDSWLRDAVGVSTPDLAAVSRRFAALGVTGLTDATPDLEESAVRLLTGQEISQRVVLLGDLTGSAPRKIVVPDHKLIDPDLLAEQVAGARPRPVALHCVTREALVLALAALRAVGTVAGDRIEHAAVAPPELLALLREQAVTVVTQPSLPYRRGDDYLADVEPDDRDCLWPFASLDAAGVPVGCASDAPYGDADPWLAIRAASTRRTASGRTIGARERVPALRALNGYLSPADEPGGAPRRIEAGAPADLVLLDRPLIGALARPAAEHVVVTMIDGVIVHRRRTAATR